MPCIHGDHIWVPIRALLPLLPTHLPACGLGKQLRVAQSLGSLYSCGRPGRGFWPSPRSAQLSFVVMWGVNHQTKDLLSVSPPLSISDFIIKTNLKKKKFKHYESRKNTEQEMNISRRNEIEEIIFSNILQFCIF